MWGHRLPRPRAARLTALAGLLLLTACATHGPAPQAGTAPPLPPTGERDATGAYRFNMTQHGRRMTADEFDAWMKARGIRVAKGAPVPPASSRATAQAKAPAKPARAKGAVATTAKPAATKVSAAKPAPGKSGAAPAPATVAVAKPKPKPATKPTAKEVSQAKAPARQGSGEG